MKTLLLILAAVSTVGIASAQEDWDSGYGRGFRQGALDRSSVFAPPQDMAPVNIGGFQLSVDRTKWGIDTAARGNTLGVLTGHSSIVRVVRLPQTARLSDAAAGMATPRDVSVRITPVMTGFNIHGIKAVYGDSPNLFGRNIHVIRYFFRNQNGDPLCFEVNGLTQYPNWDRANEMILNSLSPVS